MNYVLQTDPRALLEHHDSVERPLMNRDRIGLSHFLPHAFSFAHLSTFTNIPGLNTTLGSISHYQYSRQAILPLLHILGIHFLVQKDISSYLAASDIEDVP